MNGDEGGGGLQAEMMCVCARALFAASPRLAEEVKKAIVLCEEEKGKRGAILDLKY